MKNYYVNIKSPIEPFPIVLSGSSGCTIDTITTNPFGEFQLPNISVTDIFNNSFSIPSVTGITINSQMAINSVQPNNNQCTFSINIEDCFPLSLINTTGCLFDTITECPEDGNIIIPDFRLAVNNIIEGFLPYISNLQIIAPGATFSSFTENCNGVSQIVLDVPDGSCFPINVVNSEGCLFEEITDCGDTCGGYTWQLNVRGSGILTDIELLDCNGNVYKIEAGPFGPGIYEFCHGSETAAPQAGSSSGIFVWTQIGDGCSFVTLNDTALFDSNGSFGDFPTPKQITIAGSTILSATTSEDGCELTINVDCPPGGLVAAFSADTTTIEPSDTVQFTDLTTDITPTSWMWDFGDGETSTQQNPSHRYKFSGQFTVTLIASDGVNMVFETKTNYITSSSVSAIFTVDTTRADGETANNQFKFINSVGGSTTDIDWGDGNTDTITGSVTQITHTYATPGIYKVKFDSTTFSLPNGNYKSKFIEFNNWGSGVDYIVATGLFTNLAIDIYANDTPNTIVDLQSAFQSVSGYITPDLFKNWTPQNIQRITSMFNSTNWDGDMTQVLTDMVSIGNYSANNIFTNNGIFNSDISHWFQTAPSGVINFQFTFENAILFNQDISSWNTTKVVNTRFMFRNAQNFNQDLSGWDMSLCTNAESMFRDAWAFNQNISGWTLTDSTTMANMFLNAYSFNQNVGSWSLRIAGTNMTQIFRNSGMSTENYTDTIVGWANYVFDNGGPINVNMTLQSGMVFTNSRSGGANFANAQAARTYLVGQGWSITGDVVV